MSINTFGLNVAGGALPVVAGVAAKDFNGGVPVTLEQLCISESMPQVYVGGLPYTRDGRLCVSFVSPIKSYVNGLPIGPMNRLSVTTGVPVAHYVRGVPMAANGRIVLLSNPLPFEEPEEDGP